MLPISLNDPIILKLEHNNSVFVHGECELGFGGGFILRYRRRKCENPLVYTTICAQGAAVLPLLTLDASSGAGVLDDRIIFLYVLYASRLERAAEYFEAQAVVGFFIPGK